MSQGYTKLFGSIVHSTIWRETSATKVVWVTMLALSDADGEVMASVPGLADCARVSMHEIDEALNALLSPDKHSRTPTNEGRRIEKIAGGWRILNHAIYRDLQTKGEKRRKAAERKAAQRERERDSHEKSQKSPHTDTDTNTNTKLTPRLPAVAPPEKPKPAEKKPRYRRLRRCPESFHALPAHAEICAKRGVDLVAELEKFRDHEFATARSDWDATFRNWLRRATPARATREVYTGSRQGNAGLTGFEGTGVEVGK